MDKNFDTWFSRFMWGTDIVFLAASTPHIAAWYAHFDNPTDVWSTAYAWTVGFGLAIAIDGVSLMLLYALTRIDVRYHQHPLSQRRLARSDTPPPTKESSFFQ